MLKVALINSSHQKKNYSSLVLKVVKDELEKNDIEVVDVRLSEFNLPFPGDEIVADNSQKMRDLLISVDAFILGTPEYNGSFPAKLKLMVENGGFPSVFKGKPLGLVGFASGILGATKSLEQQRTLFSHLGAFVLPRVVSLPQIEKKFDKEGNCVDKQTENDIRLSVKNMVEFLNR